MIAGATALEPSSLFLMKLLALELKGRMKLSTIQKLHKEKTLRLASITHDLDEVAQTEL